MRRTRDTLRTQEGDTELVLAARSGNLAAREALFRRTVDFVHGLSFRLAGRLADHRVIVDQVYRSLFAGLEDRTRLEALPPLVTWLVVDTARRAIWKKRLLCRVGAAVPPEPLFEAVLRESLPSDEAAELAALYEAIERLPMKPRMAFLLRRVEAMSLSDVALALDASVAQVRRWVARA